MSDNWYYYFANPELAFRESCIRGNADFLKFRYIHQIIGLRISEFSYDNLPGDLTSQILETALFFGSRLCFYKWPATNEVMLCRYVPDGEYNHYYKPTYVTLRTFNDITIAVGVKYEDVVPVRDNRLDMPPILYVHEYMRLIDEIEGKIFKTLKVGTLPVVLVGDKNSADQFRVLARKFSSDDAFAIGDKTITEAARTYDIKLTIDPLDIYELKQKYLTECMQAIGIYNVPEKHERMLVKELADQNDFVDTIYTESRDERRLFIKEANEKFGLNIQLKETYKSNFKDTIEETKASAIAESAGDKNAIG